MNIIKLFTFFITIAIFFIVSKKLFDARITFILAGLILTITAFAFGGLSTDINNLLKYHKSLNELISRDKLIQALLIFVAYGFAFLLKKGKFTLDTIKMLKNKLINHNKKIELKLILIVLFTSYICSFSILSANVSSALIAPIFLPILIRIGLKIELAAALIMMGTFGAIINPASVNGVQFDIDSIKYTNITLTHIVPSIIAVLTMGFIFFYMNKKSINDNMARATNRGYKFERIDYKRALVSFLPFIFLMVYGIIYAIVNNEKIAKDPSYDPKKVNPIYVQPTIVSLYIILLCSICALLLTKRNKSWLFYFKYFKEGWRGIKTVFLLIIAVQVFIIGFKACIGENIIDGFINSNSVNHSIHFIMIIFGLTLLTLSLTFLTGSGDAIIAAIFNIYGSKHLPPLVGSSVWFAGEIGRSTSPLSVANKTIANEAKIDVRKIIRISRTPILFGLLLAELWLFFYYLFLLPT